MVSTCMLEALSTTEEHIPVGRGRHGEHLHAGAYLLGKRRPLRGTHQMQSKVLEVIRGHQRSSEVISGPQRPSVVIRGHQRHSSEPIKERERERESPSTGPLGGAPGRSKHAQVVVKVVVKA